MSKRVFSMVFWAFVTDVEVIARADSAGWSHRFVDRCRQQQVRFVIGHQLNVDVAKVLVQRPETNLAASDLRRRQRVA